MRLDGGGSSDVDSSLPKDSFENEPAVLPEDEAEAEDRVLEVEVAVAAASAVPRHGAVCVIGRRREMEDAMRAEVGCVGLGSDRAYEFCGVYDGHARVAVAKFCGERLQQLVAEVVEEGAGANGDLEWERLMVECFGKADDEVKQRGEEWRTVGPTEVVAGVGVELLVAASWGR